MIPELEDWLKDCEEEEVFQTGLSEEIKKSEEEVKEEEVEEIEWWVGTTGFTAVLDDCVILCSDKQKGNYSGSITRVTEKCERLRNLPVGYIRAGYEDDVNVLVRLLNECVDGGCTDVPQMANYVFNNAARSGLSPKHAGHLLIGGYTQGSDVAYLYYIFNGGVLDLMASDNIGEIHGRFQVGSGKGAAFVIQNGRYKRNMPREEGITLAEDCIWNAIKNDKNTGRGVEYVVVSKTGIPLVKRMLLNEFKEKRGFTEFTWIR